MNVLVIGGAGYIGSHCVRQLIEAGHNPIVLDNLVYGHRAALKEGVKFYELPDVLKEERVDESIFKDIKFNDADFNDLKLDEQ